MRQASQAPNLTISPFPRKNSPHLHQPQEQPLSIYVEVDMSSPSRGEALGHNTTVYPAGLHEPGKIVMGFLRVVGFLMQ